MTNEILAFIFAYVPLRELVQWAWNRRVNRQWNAAIERLGHNADDFRAELARLKREGKL